MKLLSKGMPILPVIFGISGKRLTPAEKELFAKYPVVGFILFSRNIESKEQLQALTRSLKALYPQKDTPIFIDQEGGKIARVKPPVAERLYPEAREFAKLYQTDAQSAFAQTEQNYFTLMQELKTLGIDSPCAPVADLLHEGAHDVIGSRSFGSTVGQVVVLCSAAIDGIVKAEGLPVIKHIPGHGRATVDSHLKLPVVDATIEELNDTDFAVFRQIATNSKVQWAMTAHIAFTALESGVPITFSKKGLDFIRRNIGFKGSIMSDAIEMLALHGEIGQKYGLLEKSIGLMHKGASLSQEIIRLIEDCFEIDVSAMSIADQASQLLSLKARIAPEFNDSLAIATKKAIDSGCDVVLHCTGEIDQMQAISESLYNNLKR